MCSNFLFHSSYSHYISINILGIYEFFSSIIIVISHPSQVYTYGILLLFNVSFRPVTHNLFCACQCGTKRVSPSNPR